MLKPTCQKILESCEKYRRSILGHVVRKRIEHVIEVGRCQFTTFKPFIEKLLNLLRET